jgi:hypothetical protein
MDVKDFVKVRELKNGILCNGLLDFRGLKYGILCNGLLDFMESLVLSHCPFESLTTMRFFFIL